MTARHTHLCSTAFLVSAPLRLQLLDIDDPNGSPIKVEIGIAATEANPLLVEAMVERSGVDGKEWALIKHDGEWLGRPSEFWKDRLLKDLRIRLADGEKPWEEPDALT